MLDKPGLNHYFERHIFDATIRLLLGKYGNEETGRIQLPEPGQFDDLFKEIKEMSRHHARRRADEGSKLHGAIEKFLRGEPYDRAYQQHIDNIVDATALLGIDIERGLPERSFAHPLGFGGKVDYHERDYGDDEPPVILDFKTKDVIEADKEYGYDEHPMQLAAYREGFDLPDDTRCLNIFVGVEDKKILPLEWSKSDLKRGWRMFELVLSLWKVKNNYYNNTKGKSR